MRAPSTAHDTSARPGPDLALLVETEARLDRALAAAREEAAATRADAQRKADLALTALDAELARARDLAAAAIAADTDARLGAIDLAAGAERARFESMRGERLARLAGRLAERIAALTDDEEAP